MATGVLPNTRKNLIKCGNGHLDSSYLLEGVWSLDKGVIKPKQISQDLSRVKGTLQGGRDSYSSSLHSSEMSPTLCSHTAIFQCHHHGTHKISGPSADRKPLPSLPCYSWVRLTPLKGTYLKTKRKHK